MGCHCSPGDIAEPVFPDIQILELAATPVTGYPVSDANVPGFGVFPAGTVDFCNVTVTYTHPGQDDELNVEVWLPPQDQWNDRILAVGGGGLSAGRYAAAYANMVGVLSEGYATFTTDGGLANPNEPAEWALEEPGVLNKVNLENWGTVSLNDMSRIGKRVVESFYGNPAEYAYFSGCSQGGRQGYELAQSFPDAFDGIAAAAPAIRLHEILMGWYWPQIQMNLAGEWPRGCEIDSVMSIALKACDGKDGVEDGIISDPHSCDPFDPFEQVGSPAVDCADPSTDISRGATFVVNATLSGIWDEAQQPLFFAQQPGTDLVGVKGPVGIANTTCYDEDKDCTGAPLPLGPWWISIFGLKDAQFDVKNLTLEQYYDVLRDNKAVFDPYVGTNNPDMRSFEKKGGKLITYHGLADPTIPSDITRDYYERAAEVNPDIADFYRLFEIPALGHCVGNGHPDAIFDSLKAWVEDGTVPDSLLITLTDSAGESVEKTVRPYSPAQTVL